MPTVRYTADGGRYRAGGTTFEPGDIADVPSGLADHLVHTVGDFEFANVTDVEYEELEDTSDDETGGGDSEAGGDAADESDKEANAAPEDDAATEDDAPGDEDGADFEVNGWLENNYQDRADAVLEGGLDDYLEEIKDAETSQTVIDAVETRRSELGEV